MVIKIFESWLANCLIKNCNTSRGGVFSSFSPLLFMCFRLCLFLSKRNLFVCFFFLSADGHSNKCWHLIQFNLIDILAKLMAFIHFYLQCAELWYKKKVETFYFQSFDADVRVCTLYIATRMHQIFIWEKKRERERKIN